MIDYRSLIDETWETASLRRKIQEVLFIFYDWRGDTDIYEFLTRDVALWTPTAFDLGQMHRDWDVVANKVRRGEAHLLSEGDGRLVGPATKGADGTKRVRQPLGTELAKPRAWAFKASFTTSILFELKRPMQSVASQLELASPALVDSPISTRKESASFERPRAIEPERFDEAILSRLRQYVGRPLTAIMQSLSIGDLRGKAKGAVIVRRALGLSDTTVVEEFARLGLEVKTVRLSPAGRPYEAMSFPAFRYSELVAEDWEDSDLLSRLNRLLIVPIVGEDRDTPFEDCILRQPFFWTPSADELRVIEREWAMFKSEIASGHADDLTPASRTQLVHVRPKGRNRSDTDDAPGIGPVVKKCFWLNKDYVERVVRSSG